MVAASVAGCSKSTSTDDGGFHSTVPIAPTVGSDFITVDNTSTTTYDTVITCSSVDTLHSGSIVRALTETNGSNGGTINYYESFLPNGDVALEGSSTGWGASGVYEVLPFASHTTVIDIFTQSYAGNTFHDTVTAVYNGAGQSFVLNNHPYQTDSVTVTVGGDGGGVQHYYSYIPALGLMAYYGNSGGYLSWLTAYNPK